MAYVGPRQEERQSAPPWRGHELENLIGRVKALELRVSALESENCWLRRQNEALFDQTNRWREQVDSTLRRIETTAPTTQAA